MSELETKPQKKKELNINIRNITERALYDFKQIAKYKKLSHAEVLEHLLQCFSIVEKSPFLPTMNPNKWESIVIWDILIKTRKNQPSIKEDTLRDMVRQRIGSLDITEFDKIINYLINVRGVLEAESTSYRDGRTLYFKK